MFLGILECNFFRVSKLNNLNSLMVKKPCVPCHPAHLILRGKSFSRRLEKLPVTQSDVYEAKDLRSIKRFFTLILRVLNDNKSICHPERSSRSEGSKEHKEILHTHSSCSE